MKIVVSGYYGFGNAGDEAILEVMLRDLRALRPNVQAVVLSGDPEATMARFGVEAVPRLDLRAIVRALRGADLFISGGGSLLQDATGWGSVPYYAGLMWLAARLGVPVFVYAQGIGPLRRPMLRVLAGRAVRLAAAVTVRDRLSYELLRELGVDPGRMSVKADPVFSLAVDTIPNGGGGASGGEAGGGDTGDGKAGGGEPGGTHAAARIGARAAVPTRNRPLIGVSLRPLPGRGGVEANDALVEAVAAALQPRLVEWDAYAVLLPLHEPSDGPVLDKLRRKLAAAGAGSRILERPEHGVAGGPASGLGAARWVELFSQLDLCLTMRLHGMIFAACGGTPVVALSDDPKLAAHVDELGLDRGTCLVSPKSSLLTMLGAALDEAWRQREALRGTLKETVPELAERARLTAARAVELVAR